jgi:putative flippase GtrA
MRAVKFVGVGAVGFVLQLLTLAALRAAGVHYTLATPIAVELAILHNFFWHARWTWGDRRSAGALDVGRRLLRFNGASGLVSLTGNLVFTMAFVEGLGLPVIIANTLAVLCLSAANFTVANRFVFAMAPDTRVGAGRGRAPGLPPRWQATTRRSAAACTSMAIVLGAARLDAADLGKETVEGWNRYVAQVEARLARERADQSRFLWVDFTTPKDGDVLRRRLRRGEVVVQDAGTESEAAIAIPGAMIHHWRGYVFIPGVSVDDLVAAGKDPTGRRAHKQEDVIASRVLSRDGDTLRLYLKLQRRNIVTVAYNTEHVVTYRIEGQGRASSRSISAKIAELENVGTPAEHEMAVGQDRGFLWRLNSYWRYEAVHGGVIVELESLTMSRDIPLGLGVIVRPLIDRVARESVSRTLGSMRDRFVAQAH